MSTETYSSASTGYSNCSCTYWIRKSGRSFITDPNGDIVNLARLTAYAEYGDDIHDAQAHHEIPALKIDAPAFLDTASNSTHAQYHGTDPEPIERNGFPVFVIEE